MFRELKVLEARLRLDPDDVELSLRVTALKSRLGLLPPLDFRDFLFRTTPTPPMFRAWNYQKIQFGRDWDQIYLDVQASEFHASIPQENLEDPYDYEAFEVTACPVDFSEGMQDRLKSGQWQREGRGDVHPSFNRLAAISSRTVCFTMGDTAIEDVQFLFDDLYHRYGEPWILEVE